MDTRRADFGSADRYLSGSPPDCACEHAARSVRAVPNQEAIQIW